MLIEHVLVFVCISHVNCKFHQSEDCILFVFSCVGLCDPVDCRLPCPSPGDLSNPGMKLESPALQADSVLSEQPGKSLLLKSLFVLD